MFTSTIMPLVCRLQWKNAKLYLIALTFIEKIKMISNNDSSEDTRNNFAEAVTLLKQITSYTATGKNSINSVATQVPVWNQKSQKTVLKPVQDLAGLLCYSDPVG